MKIFKTTVASITAILIFVCVWFLADLALKLFDSLRNNRNFIQDLGRTLFTPGVGAYFAIIGVNKFFREYNKTVVFIVFSSALILFTVWSLYLMIPVAKESGFGAYDFSIQILTPIVAIVTAYFTNKNI